MAKKTGNSFRNSADDFQAEVQEKVKKRSTGRFAWIKDERTRRIVGAFFILFSLFLFLSFTSHIINLWGFETDQDLLQSSSWSWYSANHPKGTANMMGYFGAWFGHLFIHKWFGISSYILLFSVFTLGTKLLFNWQMYPIWKILRYTFFIIVWSSILMGFIFHTDNLFMGGGFGFYGFMWLKGLFGAIGTALFLLLYGAIFLIVVYNLDFRFGKKPLVEKDDIRVDFSDHAAEAAAIKSQMEELIKENDRETGASIVEDEAEGIEVITINEAPEIEEELSEQEEDIIEEEVAAPISFKVDPSISKNTNQKQDDFELKIADQEVEEVVEVSSIVQPSLPNTLGDEYDPRLDLAGYTMPTIDLLQDYEFTKTEIDRAELETSKNLIVETLKNYNIGISEIKANIGPTVTLYEIVPAPGVKISRIKNLEDDIALSLAALGIRIIAPIPGRGTIGIEVPNKKPEMVPMRQMMASKKFQESNFELPVILGKTISNEIYLADLAKMPHLLVAGATGQGKSVGLNTLIVSLLYKKHPAELKFVLVDPKKVELTLYNKIERHYLAKLPGDGDAIITDTKLVCNTLNSLCIEMDDRYELLKAAGKRNIIEYNTKFKERKLLPTEGHRFLPYIVVVIDEVADLMMTAGREVETPIARLAQLARAVGIHVILATQRPSVNIITGTIKANFPARLAFRVTSKIDSRTILDSNGADQLIGKGDMLYSTGNDLIRLQCPFVDTPEVEKITEFIGNQRGYSGAFVLPEFKGEDGGSDRDDFDPNDRDALFEDAARLVVMTQQGSTSLIQRKLKLGYNRAGRLVDQLEQAGLLGPFEGAKARKVLIPDEISLEQFLDNLYNK
ncbi:MAG: DNA translocase FtsK 4TM domain-containing protein [Bacteroidia bacterium]|nr:DNA translocase FtsK 4TM domain-containing protein [Bacteroidia bacterium]